MYKRANKENVDWVTKLMTTDLEELSRNEQLTLPVLQRKIKHVMGFKK